MNGKTDIEKIAVAIYTVNRHAKTALDNKPLYAIKNKAISKLCTLGLAKKTGMHFSENTKNSYQSSVVLVECGDYLFHTLPEKGDFDKLPHLGTQDMNFRNPVNRMGLSAAKKILTDFLGEQPDIPKRQPLHRSPRPPKRTSLKHNQTFRSSYLDGK